MTEVFIAAVSTTKFQLNEEDLEFYKDQKAKQIVEVRSCLEHLQQFGQLSKKQRPMANHALLWKNLLILAKIIGYESQFSIVNQLSIPQHILTQQLWYVNEIFTLKRYPPRAVFGNVDKYYILMEGVVEKEIIRSSIAKVQLEGIDLNHCRIEHGSRFRKQNRKCYGRTEDQIPICLNSKRSQGRIGDGSLPLSFRTLTETDVLEIPINVWKNYVKDFKRLQEEYLMNFIRKRLNLSLNFDVKRNSQQDDIQLTEESFYNIVTLERKSILQLQQAQIYLLYMGQMLLQTPYYRVEVSRGCILNPMAFKMLRQSSYGINSIKYGIASAKTIATVIKIPICKLQLYFKEVQWERYGFIKLLKELQQYRKRNKQQQEKVKNQLLSSIGRGLKNQYQSENKLHYSGISPKKLNHLNGPTSNKFLAKEKIIMGFKNIQNLVDKTAKAAELKHIQYLRKAHLSEDSCQSQQNILIPQSLFKDCMKNIEAKCDMLKLAVKIQRQKLQQDAIKKQISLNGDVRSLKKTDRIQTNPVSAYLLKKIKGIYVKTEGCEDKPYFTSERQTMNRSQSLPYRETVGGALNFENSQGNFGMNWGVLGVMKKVRTGKIRRVKAK